VVDPEAIHADPAAWARRGVSTVLVPQAWGTDPTTHGDLPFDFVPVWTLPEEGTSSFDGSRRLGVRGIFDVSNVSPEIVDPSDEVSVRIDVGSRHLPAWCEASRSASFRLTVANVDESTLARLPRRAAEDARVVGETTTDALAGSTRMLEALLSGRVQVVAMPRVDSPDLLKLLAGVLPDGQRAHAYGLSASVASLLPAQAHGLGGRKGRIATGADADLAVVDSRTPGVSREEQPGTTRFVLRRGEPLFVQHEVHARPGSGQLLNPCPHLAEV
jgi:hypothetical protein